VRDVREKIERKQNDEKGWWGGETGSVAMIAASLKKLNDMLEHFHLKLHIHMRQGHACDEEAP